MIEVLSIVLGAFALADLTRQCRLGKKVRVLLYISSCLLLLVHDGFRWEIGNDWDSYKAYFDALVFNTSLPVHISQTDPGFRTIAKIFTFISLGSYTIYLVLTATVTYIPVFWSTSILTSGSIVSLFLIVTYLPWFAGSQRQAIAVSGVTTVLLLVEKDIKPLYVLIFAAFTISIHASAAMPILIIVLLAISRKDNWGLARANSFLRQYSMLLIVLGLIIGLIGVMLLRERLVYMLVSLTGLRSIDYLEFSQYQHEGVIASPILGIGRKLIVLVIMYASSSRFVHLAKSSVMVSYALVSPLISLFLYLFQIYIPFVSFNSRFDLYFGLIGLQLLAGLCSRYGGFRDKFLATVMVIMLSWLIYSRLGCLNLFHPYKFFFETFERSTGCEANL